MLLDSEGRAVHEEVYKDKGKMVFDKKYRIADLPGLWVAGESFKMHLHYTEAVVTFAVSCS